MRIIKINCNGYRPIVCTIEDGIPLHPNQNYMFKLKEKDERGCGLFNYSNKYGQVVDIFHSSKYWTPLLSNYPHITNAILISDTLKPNEKEVSKEVKVDKNLVKNIIFNYPATIVIWKDGSKTIVKCDDGDMFDCTKGIALCFMKKAFGNTGEFNEVLRKYDPEAFIF